MSVDLPEQQEPAWDLVLQRLPSYRVPAEPALPPDPMGPEARRLHEIYMPLVETPRLVIAQLGQTLDGRIATRTGDSCFVSGPEGIAHLHRLRALVDAVIVGAGTVTADDPRLTVREVRGRNPVRVVLDPSGRVSPDAGVFRDQAAPTIWVRAERSGIPEPPPQVESLFLPEQPEGGFHPIAILQALSSRGLNRVLVEGGGITVSGFLAAAALDRLHVTVAPILLGSGRPSLTLPAVERLDEALRPRCRHFQLGSDMLFDLCLRS